MGGTGFYIQAMLYDIDFQEENQEEKDRIRRELTERLKKEGTIPLHQELSQVDPKAAKAIHENNKQRIIRALEYYYLHKSPISQHNQEEQKKESLYDEDISKIAGVFMNRLNKGMRLESDITVNYALQRTGVKVTHKMLQTKSPYNTYLYKGLPVGPVSSVQIKTFDRTIHYAKHDNYYFFAKKDGQVIYSKTYKQHLEAVEKYKWY